MTETKKRVTFWHERDKTGRPTGMTVCDVDGFRGFSFCFPGRKEVFVSKLNDAGTKQTLITEHKGDEFDKKIGKQIALGRAEKFAELIKEMDEQRAYDTIYSKRMQTRIRNYYSRWMPPAQEVKETGILDRIRGLIFN